MDGRCGDAIRADGFHQQTDPDHIRNRVQRAYFMEMDFTDGVTVNFAFRFRNQRIDRFGVLPDPVRNFKSVNEVFDVFQ